MQHLNVQEFPVTTPQKCWRVIFNHTSFLIPKVCKNKVGILNTNTYRFQMVEKILVLIWYLFPMGSEIWKPYHLNNDQNYQHLVLTTWNLDYLVWIFNGWNNFECRHYIVANKGLSVFWELTTVNNWIPDTQISETFEIRTLCVRFSNSWK